MKWCIAAAMAFVFLLGLSLNESNAHPSKLTYEQFMAIHEADLPIHNIPKVIGTATKEVPLTAWKYRHILQKYLEQAGHQDKLSAFAAQMMQEASWRCDLSSKYASGCAQFTKSTAKWAGKSFCRDLGRVKMDDPDWAYACGVRYMAWLHSKLDRISGECARWVATGRAYNGGLKWVYREVSHAKANGIDHNNPKLLAAINLRAKWADKENDRYMVKILKYWQPFYIEAGYGGSYICEGVEL